MEYGLMFESYYKYKGTVGSCKSVDIASHSLLSDYARVESNDPTAHKEALVKFGAVTIALEAGKLQDYQTGIFGKSKSDCGPTPNHAVVLIGYGGSGADAYWLAQNSWDSDWGEEGYFKILRSDDTEKSACGVLTQSFYPIF
jgi:C1A family cysteine protease